MKVGDPDKRSFFSSGQCPFPLLLRFFPDRFKETDRETQHKQNYKSEAQNMIVVMENTSEKQKADNQPNNHNKRIAYQQKAAGTEQLKETEKKSKSHHQIIQKKGKIKE